MAAAAREMLLRAGEAVPEEKERIDKKTRIVHPPAKPDPANSCPLEEFWPSVK